MFSSFWQFLLPETSLPTLKVCVVGRFGFCERDPDVMETGGFQAKRLDCAQRLILSSQTGIYGP